MFLFIKAIGENLLRPMLQRPAHTNVVFVTDCYCQTCDSLLT